MWRVTDQTLICQHCQETERGGQAQSACLPLLFSRTSPRNPVPEHRSPNSAPRSPSLLRHRRAIVSSPTNLYG